MGSKLMVLEAYMISAKYKTQATTSDKKLPMKVMGTQLEI
jgi:hypothetical protein